jgi:hypothetical protein
MSSAMARRHLQRLAVAPRPAGSEQEALAREYCSGVLAELGFTVNAEPFEYSAAPGRWATSAGGAVSVLALGAAGHLASRGDARGALGILLATVLLGVPLAYWTARWGVLSLPFSRREGMNLVALRGSATPPVWLVAHLDSKSQPVPTALRAGGIVLSSGVWIAAFAIAIAQWRGMALEAWWAPIAIIGAIAGLPVAASVVGETSPGALDNASGVAAVLTAAARLEGGAVGVLLTSGEELGLVGARAWSRSHAPGLALNCDGIDDVGTLVCMRSGTSGGARAVRALEAGAATCGVGLQVRGLIPGLLVDAVALSDAGWDAVTLSRGRWTTLARVHRPGDDLAHLTGAGIEEAACVLAAAVMTVQVNPTP